MLKDLCLCEPLKAFGTFKHLAGTQEAYEIVRAMASGENDKPMLLLYGWSGCGKTHLLQSAILRLYGRGIFVRYLTWARIINALKDSLHDGAIPHYRELLGNYCYARALVLDDVGMGSTGTDWEYSQLEEIVDVRYERRLLTLMATNQDWASLPDRIKSRLKDPDVANVVLNRGKDYRRLKHELPDR